MESNRIMSFFNLRPHSRHSRRLSAFVDGNLAPRNYASLERHFANCERCRLRSTELRGLRAALHALPAHEAPRSFRLTPAMAAPMPERTPQPLSKRSRGSWAQNGARAVGTLAAAALAVVLVIDLGPGSGASSSSNTAAGVAAVAPEAADAAAAGSSRSSLAPEATPAAKATEVVPTFDTGEVTAQAAGGEPTPAPPDSAPPATGAQPLTPEPEVEAPYGSLATQALSPARDTDGDSKPLRVAEVVLGVLAVAALGASLVIPLFKRKAQL